MSDQLFSFLKFTFQLFDLISFQDHVGPTCELLVPPDAEYAEHYRKVSRSDPNYDDISNSLLKYESCCRSIINCDLRKKSELNITDKSNLRHCDCESEFVKCLKDAYKNTSNQFDKNHQRLHSIYTKQCYAEDYPIEKCIKYQQFFRPTQVFDQIPVDGLNTTVRCLEYKMDRSKAKIIQNFDIPFCFSDDSKYTYIYDEKYYLGYMYEFYLEYFPLNNTYV